MGKKKFNKVSQVLTNNLTCRTYGADEPPLTQAQINQYKCDIYRFCDYVTSEKGSERVDPVTYKDLVQGYLNNCVMAGESRGVIREYAEALAFALKCPVDTFTIMPGVKFEKEGAV